MLHTLGFLAAICLTQAPAEPLRLGNLRQTFGGELGPPRATSKYLPGDVQCLVFDVENLRRDSRNNVQYSIGMDLLDAAGNAIYHVPDASQEAQLPLGGRKLPARVLLQLGMGMPAGKYAVRVNVVDRSNGVSTSTNKEFEVLPARFAIVALASSFDAEGKMPAPINAFVGQAIWLHLQVVGFERDAASQQPKIEVQQRVVDPFGRDTLSEPLVATVTEEPGENQPGVPFRLAVPLNRSGVFKMRLTAICKISGRTDTVDVPITVYPALK